MEHVADLELAPGMRVVFAVKAAEVLPYRISRRRGRRLLPGGAGTYAASDWICGDRRVDSPGGSSNRSAAATPRPARPWAGSRPASSLRPCTPVPVPRGRPARPDAKPMALPPPGLLHHRRRQKRRRRSHQPAHREDPPPRPRLPQGSTTTESGSSSPPTAHALTASTTPTRQPR